MEAIAATRPKARIRLAVPALLPPLLFERFISVAICIVIPIAHPPGVETGQNDAHDFRAVFLQATNSAKDGVRTVTTGPNDIDRRFAIVAYGEGVGQREDRGAIDEDHVIDFAEFREQV